MPARLGDSASREIQELYREHPLSEQALLDRLQGRRDITEFDLAVDRSRELTDQNHIGGLQGTIALAERARIDANDRVLDLGCGLGGPARVLAAVYRCTVHGIDVSAERILSARRLTQRVGLDGRVSFSEGDFDSSTDTHQRFSVLWAQNALTHGADPGLARTIAATSLEARARIAFEDVCMERDCRSPREREDLEQLCRCWSCRLRPASDWARGMEESGCMVCALEDLRPLMIAYLERMTEKLGEDAPERERMGWSLGAALARAGLITYTRIVAERRG